MKTSGFASLVLRTTAFVFVACLPSVVWGQECAAVHNVEISYVFGP